MDDKEGSDYYQLLEEETLARLLNLNYDYDACLADEGPGLQQGNGEHRLSLVHRSMLNFTVAVDEGQTIHDGDVFRTSTVLKQLPAPMKLPGCNCIFAADKAVCPDFPQRAGKSAPKAHSVDPAEHLSSQTRTQAGQRLPSDSLVADTIKNCTTGSQYPLLEFALSYTQNHCLHLKPTPPLLSHLWEPSNSGASCFEVILRGLPG